MKGQDKGSGKGNEKHFVTSPVQKGLTSWVEILSRVSTGMDLDIRDLELAKQEDNHKS